MNTVKTFANWKEDLSTYLSIGDIVDEELKDYFIEVLPPTTWNNQCIQMGEPYSHRTDRRTGKYRATYATLRNTSEGWAYAGHCFKGDIVTPANVTVDKPKSAKVYAYAALEYYDRLCTYYGRTTGSNDIFGQFLDYLVDGGVIKKTSENSTTISYAFNDSSAINIFKGSNHMGNKAEIKYGNDTMKIVCNYK